MALCHILNMGVGCDHACKIEKPAVLHWNYHICDDVDYKKALRTSLKLNITVRK